MSFDTLIILGIVFVLVVPSASAGVAVYAMLRADRHRREANGSACICRAYRRDCKQFRDETLAGADGILPFTG